MTATKTPKKPGRRLGPDGRAELFMHVRLTAKQRELLEHACARRKCSISALLREMLEKVAGESLTAET